MNNTRHTVGLLPVSLAFVTCLIVSNIISVKLIDVLGWIFPAAIIIFPISYIIGDILTEVYGLHHARRVIALGFICNVGAVGAIYLAQQLPAVAFWDGQAAYERILGYTPRLLLASFAAYWVGELTNAHIMAYMKRITDGRYLWVRTITSTFVAQGLDSMIFITLAFVGTTPNEVIQQAVLSQWAFKTMYEALATPLTILTIRHLMLMQIKAEVRKG